MSFLRAQAGLGVGVKPNRCRGKLRTVIYFDQDVLKVLISDAISGDSALFQAVYFIKGWTDQDVAAEIKKTLHRVKGADKDLTLCLPRQLVTLKNLELPSVKREELSSMVDFQVTRLIPHPKSEIVYDYQVLKPLPNQCSLIRVAVLHRKSIERYLSILAQGDARPKAIRLGSEALENVLPEIKTARCVVEIDFSQTSCILFREGKIHFSRSIPIGFKDIDPKGPNAATSLSDYLVEIEASLSLFPIEREKERVPIIILGASLALEFLEKPFHERFKTEIQRLEFPLKVDTVVGEHELPKVSFGSLLSLTKMQDPEKEFNLLPQDIQLVFEKAVYRSGLKKLLIMGAATLLVACWTFMKELKLEAGYLTALKLKIKSIETAAGKLEELKDKILILKDHVDERDYCLNVITALLESVPEEIYLKTVSYEGNKISLRGYASNLSKIFELTAILEKNSLFQKIDTRYARQGTSGGQEIAEFHLECTLALVQAGGRDDVRAPKP